MIHYMMIHYVMIHCSIVGAYVNIHSQSGYTPVIFAVQQGNLEAVQTLVKRYGADVDRQENDGWYVIVVVVVVVIIGVRVLIELMVAWVIDGLDRVE